MFVVFSIVLICFGFLSTVAVPVLYILIILKLQKEKITVEADTTSVKNSTVFKSIAASLANFLSWFPTSVILTTVLIGGTDIDVYDALTWTFVLLIPLNPIVYPFILYKKE